MTLSVFSFLDRLADIGLAVTAIIGYQGEQVLSENWSVKVVFMDNVKDVRLDSAEIWAQVARHAAFVLQGLNIMEDAIDLT